MENSTPGPGSAARSPSVTGHPVAPDSTLPGPRVEAAHLDDDDGDKTGPRSSGRAGPIADDGCDGGSLTREGCSASSDGKGGPSSSSSCSSPSPEEYEQAHVHSVYASIAPHFSSTRHKPWPLVASFLSSLAPGSVGLDIGCGNGKYLDVNPDVLVLGSDRSQDLAAIARREKTTARGGGGGEEGGVVVAGSSSCDVVVADTLNLPHPPAAFDFVISVAVVHHLSTRDRRRAAVAALLGCVRGGGRGRVLVYVWALEQAGSRRGWDVGDRQDTLVPWVVKGKTKKKKERKERKEEEGVVVAMAEEPAAPPSTGDETFQRYYHLYRQGELEEDCVAVGGHVLESGYEKDNWWAICTRQ